MISANISANYLGELSHLLGEPDLRLRLLPPRFATYRNLLGAVLDPAQIMLRLWL